MAAIRDSNRAGRLKRWAIIVSSSVAAWVFCAWFGARALVTEAELPHADALVVLSGSSDYVERTRRVAQLFGEGRAPKIILTNDGLPSGWSEALGRNPLFVERAEEELQRAGVSREHIIVIRQPVSSTHTEVLQLRAHATANGLRSILVVTSAYHSRRALWTLRRSFRATGIDVGLTPVALERQAISPFTWWLSSRGWRAVAGEYVKHAYYLLKHR